MTLFLTSSPCVPNADRAILNPANDFVRWLRAFLPKEPRCLFVCSSPDSPQLTDRFGQDMADAFREAGMPFSRFDVLDPRTESHAGELIADSDLVILAGGHVPTQNRYFHKIGLRKLLGNYGGVVMGISAGTMNAAGIVYAQPELPGETLDPNYRRFIPGLELTWINVLPHYQQVKDDILDGKRLYEDITFSDSHGKRFYALPDGSYVFSRNGETLLCGEAYLIENGIMRQISEENDVLTL